MTDTIDIAASGEARLKSRRARFYRFCALGFAGGIVTGFATGFASDLYAEGVVPTWVLYLFWALALAGFAWFTVEYFRRVDELDVMDNLWASLVALYFYLVALPSWWLFHDMELVPEVNHVAIYLATAAAYFIIYGVRKLGLR
ncbi:hypothetical protein [Aurantiacibacter poecillastricola]|uniref:hypothetical protein n=1 Tax=Aurantiacibacter poecillastricola TaxID=3064385 RepID=UPI00273EEA6E|nr:hypothetical protein [Aurantiacibacter sp. 219JJ12-13]MDP5262055.1 hypothetical protein [Aurantiacibacter sp. 219JJ12-13]